VLCWM